jgi:hypothetical protein
MMGVGSLDKIVVIGRKKKRKLQRYQLSVNGSAHRQERQATVANRDHGLRFAQ